MMIATLVFHVGRDRAILTYAVKSRHKREEKTTHTHDTPFLEDAARTSSSPFLTGTFL